MLLWQISDISYTRYNALLIYSRQMEIEVYPPFLPCLSLAIILFSSFRFRLIGSTCRNRFIELWLYAPFRVLLWCFRSRDFTLYGVLLLLACLLLVPLALITPCQSAIMQYLHLVREYPSAQFTQDRRAVLIVPCSLFACCFFVAMTNNGPIAVIGDTASQARFSPLLATYTTVQFSNIMPFGFPCDGDIIANVEIVP